MYSCATIIFGYPLVSNRKNVGYSEDLEECIENREEGFQSYYSGSHDQPPAAFGVVISEMETVCAYTDLRTTRLEPTEAQKIKLNTLFNALDENLQKEIKGICPEPFAFVLWSTS